MSDEETLSRQNVPVQTTWNRESVYPTWEDLEEDYETGLQELPELFSFAGLLSTSLSILVERFKVQSG